METASYAAMSNQELITAGTKRMEETDQAIERSKVVLYVIQRSFLLIVRFAMLSKLEILLVGCGTNNRSGNTDSSKFEGPSK